MRANSNPLGLFFFEKSRLTLLAVALASHLTALAQVQDSVFMQQSLSLPPKGKQLADTRCMNEHFSCPSSGDLFRKVTYGGKAAYIEIGGKQLPLQEAIDQHKVAIRG